MSKIDLYQGDCLEVMDKLIEQGVKVDLTITSPPYDNMRTYSKELKWNEEIWKSIINKLYNITIDGGVVVWIVGDSTVKGSETGTSFKQALYFKEVGFNLHDTMIYAKNNPIPLNHNRYDPCFEYMFVFSKGKPNIFNPLTQKCKTIGNCRSYKDNNAARIQKGSAIRIRSENITTNKNKYKTNIWYYNIGNNQSSKDKIAFKHPAIFPEQLANDHIISWSNEGNTIFDPFMGSGTTGKMSKLNNRKFIGIEKVEKYFKIAQERINNK